MAWSRGALVKRSLGYFWRTNLGVVLGAAVAAAVLVGALLVGDSVRYSLRQQALERLGSTHASLSLHDRFFRDRLAQDAKPTGAIATAVLRVQGAALNRETKARANSVQLLGIRDDFFRLTASESNTWQRESGSPAVSVPTPAEMPADGAYINDRLAKQLGISGVGDTFLLRIAKPSVLPRDAPLSVAEDLSVTLELKVAAILDADQGGHFNLRPDPTPPFNVYVPLKYLQDKASLPDRANVLLVSGAGGHEADADDGVAITATANAAVVKQWQLGDVELDLRILAKENVVELRTDRIFLDGATLAAASKVDPNALRLLTYFVNEIKLDEPRPTPATTPYSMVTAMVVNNAAAPNPLKQDAPAPDDGNKPDGDPKPHSPSPEANEDANQAHESKQPGNAENGDPDTPSIWLTPWLAEDLTAKVGDKVKVRFFVLGASRQLEERTAGFRVAGILPADAKGIDKDLMPAFPGLADVDEIDNWQPGIPVDLDKIRDKDRDYWKKQRGTPKALISYATGKALWANRFGLATAVRYPIAEGETPDAAKARIEKAFREHYDATALLRFQPVRQQHLAASKSANDFGVLFLSLSFFLVLAALILMGLLFVFGVEQRAAQIGTLMAVGYTGKQVRRLLLAEGAVLSVIGCVIGSAIGMLYTKGLVYGLSNLWAGAVAGNRVMYHAEPATVIIGGASGVAIALITVWFAVRRLAKVHANELLQSGADRAAIAPPNAKPKRRVLIAIVLAIGAVALGIAMAGQTGQAAAGGFFGAGALLLTAGLLVSSAVLLKLSQPKLGKGGAKDASGDDAQAFTSLSNMGLRSSARRRGRSLATICLLACGVFLVIAVGAFRVDPTENAEQRSAGTGGFAYFGETDLPVLHDLNTAKGRDEFAVDEDEVPHGSVVNLRVREGDNASCLNLNQVRQPRLLGVNPAMLENRKAFTFANSLERDTKTGWQLLDYSFYRKDGTELIPAVVDMNTAMWALHKSVGDTIDYQDEQGKPIKVIIVGLLANSMLQGDLIVSEKNLIRMYPSNSGYKAFLVDAGEDWLRKGPWVERRELTAKLAATVNQTATDIKFKFPVDAQALIDKLDESLPKNQRAYQKADVVAAYAKLRSSATREKALLPANFVDTLHAGPVPSEKALELRETLSEVLEDHGLQLTSSIQRLADFTAVQNTYLDIFQALGGLGLLLGSLGLGVVVLRNILERRGELGLMRAIGFANRSLKWMLMSEHWLLLVLGLLVGTVAAVVGVLPSLMTPGATPPYAAIAITVAVIVVSGVLWTYLAATASLRGKLMDALRDE